MERVDQGGRRFQTFKLHSNSATWSAEATSCGITELQFEAVNVSDVIRENGTQVLEEANCKLVERHDMGTLQAVVTQAIPLSSKAS